MRQQGLGSFFFSKTQPSESEFKGQANNEKAKSNKVGRGWPSFRQLVDFSKLSLEALTSTFFQFIPWRDGTKRGLTPLKDSLRMPEDEAEPQVVNKQSTPAPLTENKQVHTPSTEKYSEMKPPKIKSSTSKDHPSLSSKHRSSKGQEYAEFYRSSEIPPYFKSKSQKQRSRHRQREKSGEVVYGAEPKPADMRGVDYDHPKFHHYNMRTMYVPEAEDSFRFNPH